MISRPLFLVALCLTALPLLAQEAGEVSPPPEPPLDMVQIEAAWAEQDFETVRRGLSALARDGNNGLALFRLGRVLAEGIGGPQDRAGAIVALERAVALNQLAAATLLARLHLSGGSDGQSRDAARAAVLLQQDASRDLAEAKYYLALLLAEGDGLPRDPVAAQTWLSAAAEQQYAPAQLALAKAHGPGGFAPEDPALARFWLQQAAENNVLEAQLRLAGLLEPEDPATARLWYGRAAERGHLYAARKYGTMLLLGLGGAADPEAALPLLQRAARKGDAAAFNQLGYAYARGLGTAQDDRAAVANYRQAVDSGLPQGMLGLAQLIEAGRGTEADLQQAALLYLRAADQGLASAAARLVTLTLEGALDGLLAPHALVPHLAGAATGDTTEAAAARLWLQDQARAGLRPAQLAAAEIALSQNAFDAEADAFLRAAATGGEVAAQLRLGQILSSGEGGTQDYVAAHSWLNIAATSGAPEAAALRDTLTQLMTPDQIAEAQDRARAFLAGAEARAPQTIQTVTVLEQGQKEAQDTGETK